MTIYRLNDDVPRIAPSAFVAREATLIGKVSLGEQTSVWPGAVVRADNEPIRIGDRTNVQEGAVLHADPGFPLTIGEDVTVGHQAMLHGCTIGPGSLIGIQAVVLNGATIGRHCLIGAGAIVTEGKAFPDRSLILGVPAKVVRELTDEDVARLQQAAEVYTRKADLYRSGLQAVE
ncbi:MAG TPA: gamma carbonic anhydrase family protein [Burkholderiaceae bacterium]|nr:gamma carbonic anhydrase family protein [Burkholderiaceae bacterium]